MFNARAEKKHRDNLTRFGCDHAQDQRRRFSSRCVESLQHFFIINLSIEGPLARVAEVLPSVVEFIKPLSHSCIRPGTPLPCSILYKIKQIFESVTRPLLNRVEMVLKKQNNNAFEICRNVIIFLRLYSVGGLATLLNFFVIFHKN